MLSKEIFYTPLCIFNILWLFSFSYTFASGSPDNIKQWKFPDGNFIQNLSGHNAIINTLTVNSDGVLVSGGKWEVHIPSRSLLTMYIIYVTESP